jgi:hypothetical protein
MVDGFVAPRAVEHSVEQFDVALLLVEEMVEFEPVEVTVFQPCKLLEEDDRAAVAVAVQEREAAPRFLLQQRPEQGHDGGDPRPAGDADYTPLRLALNSVVNEPCGGITSSVSPGLSWSPTQLEKTPPGIRLTVTIQSCSSGAVHSE